MKRHRPGADRAPERYRAGGGLLGGKDPAGRFALALPSVSDHHFLEIGSDTNFLLGPSHPGGVAARALR